MRTFVEGVKATSPRPAMVSLVIIFAIVELVLDIAIARCTHDGEAHGQRVADGARREPLQLERIEVLRGPQGTLYGKNTIGGALKVVTRKPGQQFHANGSIAIGSYDQFELKGSASGPVSNTLAVGFAVVRATRDGYVEDRLTIANIMTATQSAGAPRSPLHLRQRCAST